MITVKQIQYPISQYIKTDMCTLVCQSQMIPIRKRNKCSSGVLSFSLLLKANMTIDKMT